MSGKLYEALVDLQIDATVAETKAAMAAGRDALDVLEEGRRALTTVGERFDRGEYFLSELTVAAEAFRQVSKLLEPSLAAAQQRTIGTVVIGTVKGDIHDLGKNIVATMLRASGFLVHDLGVDVAPGAFVAKVRETDADIVALSALLTVAFDSMRATTTALQESTLPKRPSVMIGGGPVDEMVRRHVGADGVGRNAAHAVTLAKALLETKPCASS